MKLEKRYNTKILAWEVGYWISNTRFIVIDTVQETEDLKFYQEYAA